MCAHSPEEPGDKPRSNSLARTRQGGVAKTLECRVSGSVNSCCGALSGGWKAVCHMCSRPWRVMMLAVMMLGLSVSCHREEARRCEVGASGPHSRPRSSVVVTGSHRVVASVFRGFYRGTPVVFSSTKLIHEFGVHLRAVQRDVPCAPAVGRCVGP